MTAAAQNPWSAVRFHAERAEWAYGAALAVPVPKPPPKAGPAPDPTPAPPRSERPAAAVVEQTTAPARAAGADPADQLAALAAELSSCSKCRLKERRTHVVFGEGSPAADVVFVGEAPGFHEDKQGRPFVGKAGQLLDRIITQAMGLRREDVYIANVNKCRPPENRDPQPDEVAACLPHLESQLAILRPRLIVTLGRVAAHNLLSTTAPMRALRGRALEYEGIPVIATWHPAYLLRNPSAKGDTWTDIKRANRLLGRPEDPRRG